ncbi:uncharacterized protein G2W53_033630 [Senna tora]|uniref:Uncharacterized protein n=1 Tax=Senna tora TaxID=362788 RepID=A0A834T9U3_9FABA|nr:uncharacterized protein G2W53_033630 [Senna tora]
MLQLESSWHGRSVDHVLNIFRTTNRGRISETFTNYEAKDLLRKRSVDHVSTNSGRQNRGRNSETFTNYEAKGLVVQGVSNMSVPVVFANRSGFDAPMGIILAWEERGSRLNIFWMKNHCRISETFTNYEAKDLLRNRLGMGGAVDHVSTYPGRQIAVGSQKPSRITRQKTCCASESNTLVRVVFANRSGFDAPIGVVFEWEERGSCLNIFRRKNHDRISETFTNYEAKDMLRNLLGMEGAWIMSQHIPDDKSRSDLRNLLELRGQKTCCACELNTSVRVVFANRSGFDAPMGVVLAWEESGSCLNIFQTKKSRSDLRKPHELRVVLDMGGAWIMSQHIPNDKSRSDLRNLHELRGKRLVAQELGSCLNIFRTTNRGRISETLHELRGKGLCAQVSQTRRFANRSGFDAPIGVFLAWEVRGSCLNIFWTTNRGRISETFTNYEAKDLFAASESNMSVRVYSRTGSGFAAPIGVRLGMGGVWIMSQHIPDDKSRSDLRNLHELRAKDLLRRVSQTRRFALVFANRSGFDAPIRVFLGMGGAWIMSQHILDDKSRSESHKPSRIMMQRLVCASESKHVGSRTVVVLMLQLESSWHGRSVIMSQHIPDDKSRSDLRNVTNYEAKDLLRK